MIFKPYLKLLDIYYGAKCNLACHQCDTRSDILGNEDLDPSIDNILEGITLAREKFEIEHYSVLGGEPLLYLEKIDIIFSHIRKIDPTASIVFSTNGTLLSKKIDQVKSLMIKHNVNLFVCNHFASFDQTMTDKIKKSVDTLVKSLDLKLENPNVFFKDFMKLDNPKKDPFFQKWIDQNKNYFLGDQPNDFYYRNENLFVHFRPQLDFKKNHYMLNGKPKPHMTGLPHVSFKDGCSSVMCSFLIGKKLYKCAALGTLEKFLSYHKSLDDSDWQKYLNYKYLDLQDCSEGDAVKFHVGKYCAVSECDMCGTNSFNRNKEMIIHVRPSGME